MLATPPAQRCAPYSQVRSQLPSMRRHSAVTRPPYDWILVHVRAYDPEGYPWACAGAVASDSSTAAPAHRTHLARSNPVFIVISQSHAGAKRSLSLEHSDAAGTGPYPGR